MADPSSSSPETSGSSDGMYTLTHSSLVTYEHYPILEVICNKFTQAFVTDARDIIKYNIEINILKIKAVRFGDYINAIEEPALVNIFNIVEWSTSALLVIEGGLFYAVVDLALGGKRALNSESWKKRQFTSIELTLVERFARSTLHSFAQAFASLEKVRFDLVRHETVPRFATIVHPTTISILMSFEVAVESYRGQMHLLMPYSSLEPVRDKLSQMYTGEKKTGSDNVWEEHMRTQVEHAQITLTATLFEQTIPLDEVLTWKTGDRIIQDLPMNPIVKVRAADRHLFNGRMGNTGVSLAVKIEQTFF